MSLPGKSMKIGGWNYHVGDVGEHGSHREMGPLHVAEMARVLHGDRARLAPERHGVEAVGEPGRQFFRRG